MKFSKQQIQEWYNTNKHRFEITQHSKTWLHYLGFLLHQILFKGLSILCIPISLLPKRKYKLQRINISNPLVTSLRQRRDLYRKLIQSHQDEFGFIMTDKCDATLYSGLIGSVEIPVDIKQARDVNGFWKRRPKKLCYYPNGESGSSFSRDMLLGLLWWIWRNKDLTMAEELYKHLKDNNFVMGIGDPSRLLVMSGLEATLAEIIYRLGGNNYFIARKQFQSWPIKQTGYRIHLTILHGLLRGELLGYIDKRMYKAFQYYGENTSSPVSDLAYTLYCSGNGNKPALSLTNPNRWPKDRLPTNKDRRAEWIHTQEEFFNFEPASDEQLKEYTGGDLLFYSSLLLERIK